MEKKQRNLFIIGIITLLILVGGATYAYFQVGTSNLFGTSTINATADNIGSVILTGEEASLTIDLTAVDMMQGNSNINYYATPTGKSTDASDKEHLVATATVSPNTDTNYYHCTYTLEVSQSYSGDKNMYRIFKGLDQVNNETYTPSENELILIVNGTNYDLSLQANSLTKEIEGEFYIKGNQEVEITAGLELVNLSNKNQNLLAGSGVNISIGVKSGTFTCSAEEEPQEIVQYWTYEGTNVGSAGTGNAEPRKVSNYQNLNVYRRFDSEASGGYGRYYIYPASALSTCESYSGTCENVTQPYFVRETTRQIIASEDIHEVLYTQDEGETWNIYRQGGGGHYNVQEYSDWEVFEFGETGILTCNGEININYPNYKCITLPTGSIYSETMYEVCSNFGNTLVCMRYGDWNNSEVLKNQLENAGLECIYYDRNDNTFKDAKPNYGDLYCTDSDPTEDMTLGTFYCDMFSNDGMEIGIYGAGSCSTWADAEMRCAQ